MTSDPGLGSYRQTGDLPKQTSCYTRHKCRKGISAVWLFRLPASTVFCSLSEPPGQCHTGSMLAGGSTRSQFECAVHPASTRLRLCQSALRSGSFFSMCRAACRSVSEGQCHASRPFSFHAAQHTAASVCNTSGTPRPPSTAVAASETAGSEDRGPDGKTPDWASPGEVITYTRSSGGRYLPSPCA